jgi:hypothetical protein
MPMKEDPMKYLFLICVDGPIDASPEEMDPQPWVDEMDRRGARLLGDRISPDSDTAVVRIRGGGTMITDGPFIETKEQVAGFDVIECADLDEAIEIASKHPMAKFGVVEIRPFWTP